MVQVNNQKAQANVMAIWEGINCCIHLWFKTEYSNSSNSRIFDVFKVQVLRNVVHPTLPTNYMFKMLFIVKAFFLNNKILKNFNILENSH